jgi:hypothetical protein
MHNTIICAIAVIMLASTAAVAKPRDNHANGQTREQYCRQLVGPEKAPPCDRRSCAGMIA